MKTDPIYTRSVSLYGYAGFIKPHGGDMHAIFEEVGLDPELLNNQAETFLSFRLSATTMEIAAHRLNMPSLGLQRALTEPDHFPGIGPILYTSHFAHTAQEILQE